MHGERSRLRTFPNFLVRGCGYSSHSLSFIATCGAEKMQFRLIKGRSQELSLLLPTSLRLFLLRCGGGSNWSKKQHFPQQPPLSSPNCYIDCFLWAFNSLCDLRPAHDHVSCPLLPAATRIFPISLSLGEHLLVGLLVGEGICISRLWGVSERTRRKNLHNDHLLKMQNSLQWFIAKMSRTFPICVIHSAAMSRNWFHGVFDLNTEPRRIQSKHGENNKRQDHYISTQRLNCAFGHNSLNFPEIH